MPTIAFIVKGMPPKKKSEEKSQEQLDALTEAAKTAFKDAKAFEGDVSLTLRVYLEKERKRRRTQAPGDLDNLVSGVCDVLANDGQKSEEAIAFNNDEQVVQIFAERREGCRAWYEQIFAESPSEKFSDWYEVVVAEVKPKEEPKE